MEKVTKDNIKSILLAGESDTVEFKTRVGSAIKFLPRIISAFANTEGGVIIFGYDERHRSIIGTSAEEFEMINNVICRNKIDDVCHAYIVQCEEKTLIVIQVEKSKSIVVAGGGAYIRKGDSNILPLTSEDMVAAITNTRETAVSKEDFNRLEKLTVMIYDELLRSQKAHEEELKEQNIAYEREMKATKRSNWFFCILSAVIGYGLSKIF